MSESHDSDKELPAIGMFWKALVVAFVIVEASVLADSFLFNAKATLPIVIVFLPLVVMAFIHMAKSWLWGQLGLTLLTLTLFSAGKPTWAGSWSFVIAPLYLAPGYLLLLLHIALWLQRLQHYSEKPKVTSKDKMDQLLEHAKKAFNQHAYAEAIEYFEQAKRFGELDRLSVFYLNQAKEKVKDRL
ncbi:MAG: hypothetical protein CMF25_07175 [Kangiellaceae bacterium]|mgnify:CR=1 FL=1|nr:hypothetical protein [Kangiellaceae bacterium]|tara:strand:- start:1018 stop:1575 length:558 start_codon:yes stop_codon:yes gene_type:complete